VGGPETQYVGASDANVNKTDRPIQRRILPVLAKDVVVEPVNKPRPVDLAHVGALVALALDDVDEAQVRLWVEDYLVEAAGQEVEVARRMERAPQIA
jgi:hypothetical protein